MRKKLVRDFCPFTWGISFRRVAFVLVCLAFLFCSLVFSVSSGRFLEIFVVVAAVVFASLGTVETFSWSLIDSSTLFVTDWPLEGSPACTTVDLLTQEKLVNTLQEMWEINAFMEDVTLPMLSNVRPKQKDAKIFKNHQNPVMLVSIGYLLLGTLRWVPICQGFSNFSGLMHHFILAKLATSRIRVNTKGPTFMAKSLRQKHCLKSLLRREMFLVHKSRWYTHRPRL